MANKIVLKKSSVAGKVPLSTDLEIGEIAVNLADAKLYSKDASGTVIAVGGGGSGSGDVTGPASSTDNAITRFNGTSGKVIQDSSVVIDDSGNTSGINAITFDTTPTTTPTTEGTLFWDSADGNQTLSLVMAGGNAVQQIGEEQYYRIKASAPITEGQVVMFTGTVGASGGLTGAPATGLTAATASYVMGIATQNFATNDWGYVTSFGLVRNIDTSAFTNGAILYLDPNVAGGLTTTIPSAPNPKVQVCACVYASGSNGSLFVRPSFGGTLGQYEGDVSISSPSNGQLLIRDQTAGKWVNASLTAGTGISITDAAGSVTVANTGVTSVDMSVPTGLSVSGNPITTSGTLALTFASGYSIPTTTSQTNWDSAYSERLQWDGGSTNLVAATGRTSLGLVIGTDVQAYDANLTAWAAETIPAGDVVGTTATQTLTNKTITGLKETKVALAANNVDLTLGNYFSKTITTTTTFTVSNTAAANTANTFILDLTNGGAFTITWWANVKWAGGTAPTLTTTGRDILGFYTYDNGSTWNGLVLAKDVR